MSKYTPKTILVTGGAGFIGSNFVRFALKKDPDLKIVVLDLLTYAGNEENLDEIKNNKRFTFVKGDIRDSGIVNSAMKNCDAVVHFAAESHVDRSILAAQDFISTNIYGTYVLLQAALKENVQRFINISTDEVYGSIAEGEADENFLLKPSSPYSASKAGQDQMAHAHHVTFNAPIITTRSTNNFGPYQYPEKMIPLFVTRALENKPLPVYGDGLQVRDWTLVEENCEAIFHVLLYGEIGEIYNIGSGNQLTNLELTRKILQMLGKPETLVTYVEDRKGHDRRYSVSCEKIKKLGWTAKRPFHDALAETISWYQTHRQWWEKIIQKQKSYQEFISAYYKTRV
jgi:dTDP-glucose 4,6-dehydratase